MASKWEVARQISSQEMVFAMQQQQSCERNCSRWLFSGDLSAVWVKNWPKFSFLALWSRLPVLLTGNNPCFQNTRLCLSACEIHLYITEEFTPHFHGRKSRVWIDPSVSAKRPRPLWDLVRQLKSIRYFSSWNFYPINDLNFFFKAL